MLRDLQLAIYAVHGLGQNCSLVHRLGNGRRGGLRGANADDRDESDKHSNDREDS